MPFLVITAVITLFFYRTPIVFFWDVLPILQKELGAFLLSFLSFYFVSEAATGLMVISLS